MDAKHEAGYQLHRVQVGLEPTDWKPLKSVGAGVREIRISGEAGAFRVIYVAKFKDAVHVLHCFQKRTQATPRSDIELARNRYRNLKRIE